MKILVSTLSHAAPHGGAIYAMDLESGETKSYWFHRPTIAKLPFASESHPYAVNYGLTGMCWKGDRLLVGRWSDILVLSPLGSFPPERFEIVDVITHPLFNDIHDIRSDRGDLLVVSTGVETVFAFDESGSEIAAWDLSRILGDHNPRIRPGVPYHKYSSTKPHAYHVNMAVRHFGDLFVTLCTTGEIARISENESEIVVTGLSMPHDGEFVNDGRNFVVTSAEALDFHFFEVEDNRFKEICRIELPGGTSGKGWLRGVLQVGPNKFLVGMSVWKHSAKFDSPRVYEVDVSIQRVTRSWLVPPIIDFPDTKYRSRFGRSLHRATQRFRVPFYGNPNIYKIISWHEPADALQN